MKTCPGCRTIHQDDYNGTCQDCGAPLGNVQPNGGGMSGGTELSFRRARQIQQATRENALFSPEAMAARRGNVDGPIEESVVEMARAAVQHFGFIRGNDAA